ALPSVATEGHAEAALDAIGAIREVFQLRIAAHDVDSAGDCLGQSAVLAWDLGIPGMELCSAGPGGGRCAVTPALAGDPIHELPAADEATTREIQRLVHPVVHRVSDDFAHHLWV